MNLYHLQESKQELLTYLHNKGISDSRVLNVMANVPREYFVHSAFVPRAYEDISLPLGYDQTISQPLTVARMTQALELQSGEKVLEIGTGSGYQAAILSELGCEVHSIERIPELHSSAMNRFDVLGFSIHCYFGDGTLGLPMIAPFERIIITAASPDLPKSLALQLTIGGIMVCPIGNQETQLLHSIKRVDELTFDIFVYDDYMKFVPLIGYEGW